MVLTPISDQRLPDIEREQGNPEEKKPFRARKVLDTINKQERETG
ncbi:MAG: hypothetical protein ACFFD4_09760 [Candidatus Odinarchaeota archaeon]